MNRSLPTPSIARLLGLALVALLVCTSTTHAQTGAGGSPATPSTALTPAVSLETVEVLGTRIRRTEVEGPSPVNTYTIEDLRSSGALTVSDFLNTLPQTYSGITVGRNSTPSDLNMEFGQRNEGLSALIPSPGASPNLLPPAQTGVAGVSLRSLGAGSTLVLVDGRRVAQAGSRNMNSQSGQGFVDLNTIPMGLIDHIEVITDGASAIYGADAVAGVVNIVTKKNWVGTEISGTYKATMHGGARERGTTLTSGFASGKLRGTLAIDYYDRSKLTADQRSFSKNMDHRGILRGTNATTGAPIYGTDQRIQFGYPATVQALVGTTAGDFTALPGVRVVLAPTGALTTPALSAFLPTTTVPVGQAGTIVNAQGQRATNVSNFLELVPEAQRYGVNSNFTYAIREGWEAYGSYSFSDSRGLAGTLPAYSAASTTGTLVPAAYNPFNQNVMIGMLHPEFGTVTQSTRTASHSVTAGLRGRLSETWRWDSGFRWQRARFYQMNRNFNGAALTAALANPDAALRLNPFIDAVAAGLDRSAIYERMALYPTVDAVSGLRTFDASANGDMLGIWGGPVKAAVGGSYDRPNNTNTAVAYSAAVTPVVTTTTFSNTRNTYAAFGELSVPLFGKPNALPGLRRFDVQLAARYEDQDAAGSSTAPKYGVSWVPLQSVLFRASYSEGFRAPSLTENRVASSAVATTVNDPRRGNLTTAITLTRGSNPALQPETSTNEFYGVVYEPTFAKGLTLQVNYYRTLQKDAIQSLSTTVLLNNEALFPGRVIRTAPTAADTAAGQPGAITEMVTYFVNFGEVRNESVDYLAEYRLPWEKFGRWRVSLNASNTRRAERKLAPGQAAIDDLGDTYSGPKWKTNTMLAWQKGAWNVSTSLNTMSGFKSNQAGVAALTWTQSTPAMRKVDLRGGYDFKDGVWRKYGKGLRVNVGVSNLFDKKPPFYDVIYGYNSALHSPYVFGRTLETSFTMPF
jgi:iron complex outermembrane receptor protein